MVSEVVAAAGVKAFGGLLTKLVAEHIARVAAPAATADKVKTVIQPHMEATFKRCSTIKTLLNTHPADFLSIYARQRFHIADHVRDEYDLVEYIKNEQNNVIITGTGGSGKSMFMRYLWISLFEDSNGRIPLFIELRNMNSVSQNDLLSYMYYTLSEGKASISQRDFNKKLELGAFVVLLDGFDELAGERREQVQLSIMSLAHSYPELKLIVSSRPDQRFESWTSFHVVGVAPMEVADVIQLVEKAEFDEAPKERFIKKLKDKAFYDQHQSFLKNPLLSSMMLLTFSFSYDIPLKMHLFYDQAFDALYQRHDRHKPGGYTREYRSKLTEDAFRRLLSYFCLVTYYDERFEFERAQIIDYIAKAIGIEKVAVTPEAFLSDLEDCVCMIVREGVTYTFAHRSFQEYFAAYCLAFVTKQKMPEILLKFSNRPHDDTMYLLEEMNPEAFRENYTLPVFSKNSVVLQSEERTKDVARFLSATRSSIHLIYFGEESWYWIHAGDSEAVNFLNIVGRLSNSPENKSAIIMRPKTKGREVAIKMQEAHLPVQTVSMQVGCEEENYHFYYGSRDRRTVLSDDQETLKGIFAGSILEQFIERRLKATVAYVRKVEQQGARSANAMRDIFGPS